MGAHDLVNGRRIKRADTFLKRLASRIANGVRRRLLQDNSFDTACGLKVFRRECIEEIPMYSGMHRFIPALFTIKGFSMIEIEVNDDVRKYGSSKFGNFSRGIPGVLDMLTVYWMRKRSFSYDIRESKTNIDTATDKLND